MIRPPFNPYIFLTTVSFSWNDDQQQGVVTEQERVLASVHGFGNISRRRGSIKPMIAAVNGGYDELNPLLAAKLSWKSSAYGGGVEIILNCDLVVASDKAQFALPEVKRGVVAIQGGMVIMLSWWMVLIRWS